MPALHLAHTASRPRLLRHTLTLRSPRARRTILGSPLSAHDWISSFFSLTCPGRIMRSTKIFVDHRVATTSLDMRMVMWSLCLQATPCTPRGDSPRKTPQLETSPTELGSEVAIE